MSDSSSLLLLINHMKADDLHQKTWFNHICAGCDVQLLYVIPRIPDRCFQLPGLSEFYSRILVTAKKQQRQICAQLDTPISYKAIKAGNPILCAFSHIREHNIKFLCVNNRIYDLSDYSNPFKRLLLKFKLLCTTF